MPCLFLHAMTKNSGSGKKGKPDGLTDILASILCDIAKAQDMSNEFSANVLAEKYKNHPLLKNFPVPNALLDNLDFELKFTLDEIGQEKADKKDQQQTLLSDEMLFPLVSSITLIVQNSLLVGLNTFGQNDPAKKVSPEVVQNVKRGIENTQFRSSLNEQLLKALTLEKRMLLTENIFNTAAALKITRHWLHSSVLKHPELAFLKMEESSLHKGWAHSMEEHIKEEVESFLLPFTGSQEGFTQPKAYVNINPGSMEDIPTDFICSMRLKVDMRNFKWIIGEVGGDKLLPVTE